MSVAPTLPPPLACPWRTVGDDQIRLLHDGADAFPAMLDAIRGARREILLEMYWVGADLVGTRFRDALVERARRGVKVRVVYDALGSVGTGPAFWAPLVDAGASVHAFHKLLTLPARGALRRFEQRDHRKVLLVDREIGFTGGINLSAPWLSIDEGGAGWRDDMVSVRGPVVRELCTMFFRTWRRASGERAPDDIGLLLRKHARPVWVLAARGRGLRSVHAEYVTRIRRARLGIDIANSYFVPDRYTLRALRRAVGRGVRVRILVPEVSDVPIVQYAVEASFDWLLRHGIEVYMLRGRMLHSKTAVIDRRFATIGSFNFDHRSWRKNLELNVAVEDAAFAADMTESFERDLDLAYPVDLDVWRDRPRVRRGVEWIARRFRKLW